MSWRVVVISGTAKLDYKMNYLVVRRQDDIKRINLSEISVLLIESTAVSLTAYLICELSKYKINVIFCDERRQPLGSFIPFYGSHDTSLKVRNQMKWADDTKALVWKEIVKAKIKGQIAVLDLFNKSEADMLRSYITKIQPNDTTNREGHAAKVYFNALFGMSFSRSQKNNINTALDYGYSIILSAFAREAVINGFVSQIGIFHDNMFNQFNLACDLMEPFRPFIDREVAEMKLDRFEHDEKMQLVNVLNSEVIIDGRTQYLNNAIKIYSKGVLDAMNENNISLIKFPEYEL